MYIIFSDRGSIFLLENIYLYPIIKSNLERILWNWLPFLYCVYSINLKWLLYLVCSLYISFYYYKIVQVLHKFLLKLYYKGNFATFDWNFDALSNMSFNQCKKLGNEPKKITAVAIISFFYCHAIIYFVFIDI